MHIFRAHSGHNANCAYSGASPFRSYDYIFRIFVCDGRRQRRTVEKSQTEFLLGSDRRGRNNRRARYRRSCGPVRREFGVAVSLFIMKIAVKKWLEYAKADLEAAEVLTKHPKSKYSYQLAVLHCHQAIEKILKTVIVLNKEEIYKIHDLVRLSELSDLKLPQEFQVYIKEINVHYQPSRYPDISYQGKSLKYDYNKENAVYNLKKTQKLFLWIEKKIMLKK